MFACAVIALACSTDRVFSQVPVEGGDPNTPTFTATQLATIEEAAAFAAHFQWWATAEELSAGFAYFEIEDGEGGRLQCLFGFEGDSTSLDELEDGDGGELQSHFSNFAGDPTSFGYLWWNYFWVDPHPVTQIGQGMAVVGGGGAMLMGTGVVAGGGTVIWGDTGGAAAGGAGLVIATEAEAVTALGGFAAVGRAIGMGVGADAAIARTATITLAEVQQAGVTLPIARWWLQFDQNAVAAGQGGAAAGARVQFWSRIVQLLGG